VELEGKLPKGERPDISVDGVIVLEELESVLHIDRPSYAHGEGLVGMFKLIDEGRSAIRINARLGRSSVDKIEVVSGLKEGDQVILSDTSKWDDVERIRLN
jgi:hypothetical protein